MSDDSEVLSGRVFCHIARQRLRLGDKELFDIFQLNELTKMFPVYAAFVWIANMHPPHIVFILQINEDNKLMVYDPLSKETLGFKELFLTILMVK